MKQLVYFSITALVAATMMGMDRGCVSAPTTDTISTSAAVTVKGTINQVNDATGAFIATVDGSTRLSVNGAFRPWVSTVDKTWQDVGVPLNLGVNVISGQTKRQVGAAWVNGDLAQFIVERKNDLVNRGQQKVFLDWSAAGIDNQIKAMATHTLNGPLSAADLNNFVASVKAKVTSFFNSTYSATQVTLVAAAGAETHTVKFFGEDRCDLYGESPGDYRNGNKTQQSNIYIGTFKCVVVDDDRLLTSTPALKTDSVAQRVTDIGTFIARTVTHELGHSLGLTADGEAALHGCEGMHNCITYDDTHPSNRFDDGHFIMDPGPRSQIWARIGVKSATDRTARAPVFNSYNRSYLKVLHGT